MHFPCSTRAIYRTSVFVCVCACRFFMHHICETMKKKKEGKMMVSDDYIRGEKRERSCVRARAKEKDDFPLKSRSLSPRGKVARINTSSTTTTTRTTKTHLKHALGLVKPDVQRERVHLARVEQRHNNERKDAQREKSSRERHRKASRRE